MKKLYLGLSPPSDDKNILHYPIIQIVAAPLDCLQIQKDFEKLQDATHLIFTSKTAVDLFFKALEYYNIKFLANRQIIAIGQATKESLKHKNIMTHFMPKQATSEGIIELVQSLDLEKPLFFWPHSALSRDVISTFFKKSKIPLIAPKIYTAVFNKNLPPLHFSEIEEIIFTSPSTIDNFIKLFGSIPLNKKLTTIGPVTKSHLDTHLKDH